MRSRQVADSSLKMYFFKCIKSIYIFDRVEGLEKLYKMRVYLNNGMTVDLVVSNLKELFIDCTPSSQLRKKIKESQPSSIEPVEKKYQYEESYEETFVNKIDKATKIRILA